MRAICIFLIAMMISGVCKADTDLRTFLVSSGYGTLIGAGLGLASLAVVEDPGSKSSNIAKGASLGLYGGIGVGLYLIYKKPTQPMDEVFWLEPTVHLAKADGIRFQSIYRF